MGVVKGAYACIAMLAGFGLIAFRDPNGIRPLGFSTRKSATAEGDDYLFASESVVSDAAEFINWEDVKPGTLAHFQVITGISRLTYTYVF